jgi:hypothetical protein
MNGRMGKRLGLPVGACLVALLASLGAQAASKTVDLDGNAANGAESVCESNILQTFPVMIENKVTNRSGGDAFAFSWPSAGPGGFSSSVTPGTTGGVGAKWVWTTNQSVFSFTGNSCENDICFNQIGGPDALPGFCSYACLADPTSITVSKGVTAGTVVLNWTGGQGAFTIFRATNKAGVAVPVNAIGTATSLTFTDTPPADSVNFYVVRGVCTSRKTCTSNTDCSVPGDGVCVSRGPFGVPGRSLFSTNVTVSAASLTSSLITFFSPPKEIFRVTSTAGGGGVAQTLTNSGPSPIYVMTPAYPPGCCEDDPLAPHQMRCGETCVDYLSDPENCGACGNACGDGNCCSNGTCASLCSGGNVWCGEECADLQNDNSNCGACGASCTPGECCAGGACASLCPAGQVWCDNACVDFDNDSANCGGCGSSFACGEGSCCHGGTCEDFCPVGQVLHNGSCIDLNNDSGNCGGFGVVCAVGTCCNGGQCVSMCPAGRTYCDGFCVDLQSDRHNCGACGNDCNDDRMDGGHDSNACHDGHCEHDTNYAGTNDPTPIPAVCPNSHPTVPTPGYCHNEHPSHPTGGTCPSDHPDAVTVAGVCPAPDGPPPTENETAICTVPEHTMNLAGCLPGAAACPSDTFCTGGGRLYKEVPTEIQVCGDGIPGVDGQCNNSATKVTTGTFNRLIPVPDAENPVGNAYVTPYLVHVIADTSNDGLIEPGEMASLIIDTLNAGPMNITNASATLSAPAVDLTDDGVVNPVGLTVSTASVSYGTIFGKTPAANCAAAPLQPASNVTVFQITVPSNHPGDTSHPLILAVTGTVNGGPFSMNVPIVLGIADKCDYALHNRDFDGVDGLSNPMGKLVPVGDPMPIAGPFNAGNTRPLKLRVSCGSTNLGTSDVDAPEIIGLSEATRGELDIHAINLNSDNTNNPNDPFFRFSSMSGGQWSYSMRTLLIGTGTFTLKIRIAGRKEYVTGFVLN